ncbi:MAG: hypothetical protein WBN90_06875, partial [Gammaproteobacteria bacterium]
AAPSGRLSFGYVSLAEQRKVSRRAGAKARIKYNQRLQGASKNLARQGKPKKNHLSTGNSGLLPQSDHEPG